MLVRPQHLVEPQGAEGPVRNGRQVNPALGPHDLKDPMPCCLAGRGVRHRFSGEGVCLFGELLSAAIIAAGNPCPVGGPLFSPAAQ